MKGTYIQTYVFRILLIANPSHSKSCSFQIYHIPNHPHFKFTSIQKSWGANINNRHVIPGGAITPPDFGRSVSQPGGTDYYYWYPQIFRPSCSPVNILSISAFVLFSISAKSGGGGMTTLPPSLLSQLRPYIPNLLIHITPLPHSKSSTFQIHLILNLSLSKFTSQGMRQHGCSRCTN